MTARALKLAALNHALSRAIQVAITASGSHVRGEWKRGDRMRVRALEEEIHEVMQGG